MDMPKRGKYIYKQNAGGRETRYLKKVICTKKRKRRCVYTNNYKGVKEKRQSKLLTPNKENLTVGDFSAQWLYGIKNCVKPNTYQKYESICKNHIIDYMGSLKFKQVTKNTTINFTNNLKEKSLSAKSINDILIVLHLILKNAHEEYQIPIPNIRYIREEEKSPRVLSAYEQQQLTNYLKNNVDIYKFGILLSLYTGIRIGELCALKWEDITDDYIKIDKTMARIKSENGKTEVKIGAPKSKNSKRLIPTPQSLLLLINRFKGEGYVLSTEKSDYTEPRLMQIKFKKIISECGLEKTNFHALRHTFATRCVEAEVDIKSLSEILGHSDVKITLNKYVHSSFELKQKSMKKFELSLIS